MTNLEAILQPAYGPGDGSRFGAQFVDGKWWHPIRGPHTLQGLVDNVRSMLQLPPGYIDPEHKGQDREMLQAFYLACDAEGGTADEIHLRGIKAALATLQAALPEPSAPGEDWATVAAFAQDMRARGLAEQAHGDELLKLANQRGALRVCGVAPSRSALLPTEENMSDLADDILGIVLPEGEGARLITRALELWGAAPTNAQPAAIAQPAEGPSPVAPGHSGLTPDEIEASFRDWWKDRYGSAYFGAAPLAAVIEWTQFALPRSYRPTFQPIPVSERPPGAEDCRPSPRDGERQSCWGWVMEGTIPCIGFWRMVPREWLFDKNLVSHWAPWWAIPLPGATEMVGEEKE
jgi:hypothetical protein